ncbi:MAG: hypothetical protein LBI87_09925, partial [Candidatus Accumulibacter sp.]|nr:hypothetical protein [Accumulibacter sp.]
GIRDNLARFNRRSKRFSKTLNRLKITLDLFIYRAVVIDNAMGTFPCRAGFQTGVRFMMKTRREDAPETAPWRGGAESARRHFHGEKE